MASSACQCKSKTTNSPILWAKDLTNENVFEQIKFDVQRDNQQKLGFRVSEKDTGLIRVTSVASDAPTTGLLLPGDYIIGINGHKIKSREEFFNQVNKTKSVVTLAVARQKTNSPTISMTTMNVPQSADNVVKKAMSLGYSIKENKEYLLVQVKRKKLKNLGLGIKRNKNKIVVSRIECNSYVADILRIGDYLLAINDKKVTDKKECHKIITQNNGEFDALVERTAEECDSSTFSSKSLKSTYIEPNLNIYEHQQGSPNINYETAPEDVQTILNERIPIIVQNFGAVVKTSTKCRKVKSANSTKRLVNIENEVICNEIHSDVDPKHPLRKPTK